MLCYQRLDTLLCLLTKCINGLHCPGGPCLNTQELDVIEKTIFERLYLVQGLGTLDPRVKYPHVPTPPLLTHQLFLDFRANFSIALESRNSCNLRVQRGH